MKSVTTRLSLGVIAFLAVLAAFAGVASAQDPAVVVEPSESLTDGATVVVTISGFASGAEVTLAQCVVWPLTGPNDCDLANYGDYVIVADESGGGTSEFEVFVGTRDAITCDAETPCYLVASEGIGPDAPAAVAELTFAGDDDPAAIPEDAPTEPPVAEQISEMPQTGGEAGLLAIIGVSAVIAGFLFVGFGRRLGRI